MHKLAGRGLISPSTYDYAEAYFANLCRPFYPKLPWIGWIGNHYLKMLSLSVFLPLIELLLAKRIMGILTRAECLARNGCNNHKGKALLIIAWL